MWLTTLILSLAFTFSALDDQSNVLADYETATKLVSSIDSFSNDTDKIIVTPEIIGVLDYDYLRTGKFIADLRRYGYLAKTNTASLTITDLKVASLNFINDFQER